jgi:hypothetical protein
LKHPMANLLRAEPSCSLKGISERIQIFGTFNF